MYWIGFFVIAIFDARENRIPNSLLLILIVTRLLEIFLRLDFGLLLDSLVPALSMFGIGFVFFILRAMSPGDVKLLFVVGFVSGVTDVVAMSVYILLAGGLQSLFYFLHYRANRLEIRPRANVFKRLLDRVMMLDLSIRDKSFLVNKKERYADKLVMPFAPSIVTGMAMFYYFN
ncbi:prepilin peptidase [Vibrio breoganii]